MFVFFKNYQEICILLNIYNTFLINFESTCLFGLCLEVFRFEIEEDADLKIELQRDANRAAVLGLNVKTT